MAEDFKAARPIDYYRKFLEKNVRPDGRELGEFRDTLLNISCVSTAEGSALVKLGNTSVMCGIKVELASPKAEEPQKGYIVPNVELSPLCSPNFRPGPPGEQAQVLSQFVADFVKNSSFIDLESLCIVSGKLVWVLQCDLVCLDYDGNVTDACVLSLMAAFKNTFLPKVEFKDDTEQIVTDLSQKSNLQISTLPVSTTFAIFDDKILIVDPTAEEENLATGMLTVVTTESKLCMVHKPGGSPMKDEQLKKCFNRAFKRTNEVQKLINDTTCSVER